MSTFLTVINAIVLVYFLTINAIYTVLLALSFAELRRHNRRISFGGYEVILKSPLTLPISILMPAYNEAETIVEAVNAMRLLEYGEFEIVVIDDGSKDETLERITQAFSLTKVERPIRRTIPCAPIQGVYASPSVANLTVVAKANGGKADALNAGIDVARYPLFCAVDADAILDPDALLRVVKPFMERPRETIATSGIVRVANGCKVVDGRVVEVHTPNSRLALFQVVEYLRAFLGNRTGWSRLRALFVISGAFGLFKKQAVIEAGGYRTDTVGEDMDLVLRLHKLYRERREPYRIVYINDPVVWTEVPEELSALRRQRNRWHRGLLECLTRHWRAIGNPRYGPLGVLGLPYNLVFEAIGPLIEVAGYIALTATVLMGQANAEYIIVFFLLAVGYGCIISVGGVLLDQSTASHYNRGRDLRRLLVYTFFENFGYRQIQALWRARATLDFFTKKKSWGEMKRKGFGTS